jgi:formylglycine-generating enzyme required for sulfatase activity
MKRLTVGFWLLLMIQNIVSAQQIFLQATGESQSSAGAQQAALAELSFRIAANVEGQIESFQEFRNEKFKQTASQRLSITSQLPLLGNTIDIIQKGDTYFATARLDSAISLPLYKTRIDELTQELRVAWEIGSIDDPIRAIPSLKAAFSVIEEHQLLRLIARYLGADLPQLPVSVASITDRLKQLEQNPQTIEVAALILADSWKTWEKVYVYPPLLQGSKEITEFAAVFRNRLASQLEDVSRPAMSKFLLRGEYLVTGQGMDMIYRLQNWKGETLGTRSVQLASAAYSGLQVESIQKPESKKSVMSSVGMDSSATSSSILQSSKEEINSSESSWLDPVTKMEYRFLPKGQFEMGDIFRDGDPDEKWVRDVELNPYWVSSTEVTQQAWERVMGKPANRNASLRHPVEVTLLESHRFLKRLNEKSEGNKFRLITEAEWEYSCREGGRKVRFGNGKNEISEKTAAYSKVGIQDVGSYPQNSLGLFDLSGNVAEWTADKYQKSYRDLAELNPLSKKGRSHVVRGGGIVNLLPGAKPKHIRCSTRQQARSSRDRFGLRLIREYR